MAQTPLEIGVCSWSLQVHSVPELIGLLKRLGLSLVQIACGDPHHASWQEGDALPKTALESGLRMSGAMIGYPGEDYTTPQTIRQTGGFGDPATRGERIERFKWAVTRTKQLGLSDIMCHAGFIPDQGDPARASFLKTLGQVADIAADQGVTLSLETGQETATLLRSTLDELAHPHLKINFDPANMLLYDMGDPIEALDVLAPYLRSVHVKDARRPRVKGTWGEEVPLGDGEVDLPRWVAKLKEVGFQGPLMIEREVGDQEQRVGDIAHGVDVLRRCL